MLFSSPSWQNLHVFILYSFSSKRLVLLHTYLLVAASYRCLHPVIISTGNKEMPPSAAMR